MGVIPRIWMLAALGSFEPGDKSVISAFGGDLTVIIYLTKQRSEGYFEPAVTGLGDS